MSRLIGFFFAALTAVYFSHAGAAGDNAPAGSPHWTTLTGKARDLSINSAGQAYMVDLEGGTWHWDAVEQRWRPMSGQFVRISAAEGNRPWGINAKGFLYRYNGLWWEHKDTSVSDVAGDALGNVYSVREDGEIRKFNPLRNDWSTIERGTAKRIALDTAGHPWIVTKDGRILSFDGKNWKTHSGAAADIAINGNDAVIIATPDGKIMKLDASTDRLTSIDGVSGVVAVAAAPDGGPWAVLSDGRILASTLLVASANIKKEEGKAEPIHAPDAHAAGISAPNAVASNVQAPDTNASPANAPPVSAQQNTAPVVKAPVPQPPQAGPQTQNEQSQTGSPSVAPQSNKSFASDPTTLTDKSPISFTDTLKKASKLAIGKDGSVFSLDEAGNVMRWSNARKRFESFPGSLVRLAVDGEGRPWGISALGRVFRHDGEKWVQIPNATASDIAIGGSGAVFTADASGYLYRYDPETNRFSRASGQGVLIAVDPEDVVWSIRSDRLIQKCGTVPCKVLPQKAVSISIGPDGSLFVVSDKHRLLRLKKDGKSFEQIVIPGHEPVSVAVGPKGRPWVVDKKGHALASKFFDRDESSDRQIAVSTVGTTEGTGETAPVVSSDVTGFVFTKNMQFDTVAYTNLSGSASVHTGGDGSIWAYTLGQKFEKYDAARRKFVPETTKIVSSGYDMLSFDIASNGDLWSCTQNPTNSLFRERNNVLKEYSVPNGTCAGITISPDDTVYVWFGFPGSLYYLYRKLPNSELFQKFSNFSKILDASAGPGNDLWIVDKDNIVKQWTGTAFENRPAGGIRYASHVAVGGNGSVYIIDSSTLYKWNGTNQSFDKVNNLTAETVDLEKDGRPWITAGTTPTIKRARE